MAAKTLPPLPDPVSGELKQLLRALKLGKLLDTLPDRLALARQQHLSHADFLEVLLADEVTRRDANSASLRARAAGLDPAMRLETWDTSAKVRYDQQLWNELVSLRFLDAAHGAVVVGPVGVGKTHLAAALGHIAVRRRVSALMLRADKLFKTLKAARLDNTLAAEMRRLAHVQLLIIDDFCLQSLDATETADFYDYAEPRIMPRPPAIVRSWNPLPEPWTLAVCAVARTRQRPQRTTVANQSNGTARFAAELPTPDSTRPDRAARRAIRAVPGNGSLVVHADVAAGGPGG
jgi:DNA replication protein DnaC